MKKTKDIKTRMDIENLVNLFYEEVKRDDLLSGFFTDVNWEKHLVVMVDFWENVLLYSGDYTGNPMEQHKYLHQKMEMTKAHFERWLYLFDKATDSLFFGTNADLIKAKAQSIALVMQTKILP